MLITEKIENIKKDSNDFIKSWRQFFLKFNNTEGIRKQLTVLIKC